MSLFREDTKLQGLKGKDLVKLDLARYNVVVEDADTILLEEKGLFGYFKSPLAIRLAGIDAPEIAKHSIWDYKGALIHGYMGLEEDQPHAQEAKEWLEQRVKNSKGLVAYTAPDQETYGRSVGVLADEFSNINLQLLQYGQATALPYGPKEQDVLSRSMAAQQETFARENTLGLWNYKRYQVQHELLGSSLTHNVLMKADRGDGSYAGYRKSQLDALDNEQLDSRFSARDDNYNTIEGLGHQGIAHYFRRAMTPFGSGFQPGTEMPPALKGIHGLSDYVVFDIETTGLDKYKDQALDIAGIKYRAGQEVERFRSYIRPDIEISPGAQKVHKLEASFLNLVGQPRQEAYSAFQRFAGDLPLVGHNIEGFDVPFLNAEFERVGLNKLTNPTVDTLRAAKGAFPDSPAHSLEALVKELGIVGGTAHNAMGDVESVAGLIPRIKSSSASMFASAAEQTTKKAINPLLRKGLLIGGGLALGAAAIYGIRGISGDPRDYNTIEAMGHQGIAHIGRKKNTDFGSSVRRIWGGMERFEGLSKVNVLKELKSFISKNIDIELGASSSKHSLGDVFKALMGSKSKVQLADEAGTTLAGGFSGVLLHESLERSHMMGKLEKATSLSRHGIFTGQPWWKKIALDKWEGLGRINRPPQPSGVARTKQILEVLRGKSNFGGHASSAVIGDEALVAAKLGQESFNTMKEWRFKDLDNVQRMINEGANLPDWQQNLMKEYIRKTKKIYSSVESKHLQRLSRAEPMRMQSMMTKGAQQHNRMQGARVEPQSLAMLDDPFNKR